MFLAFLHRAERTIARQPIMLAQGKAPRPEIDAETAVPWVEKSRLTLADSQKRTIALEVSFAGQFLCNGPKENALNLRSNSSTPPRQQFRKRF